MSAPGVPTSPETPSIPAPGGDLMAALAGSGGRALEAALPAWLAGQRWFAGKGRAVGGVRLHPLAALGDGRHVLAVVDVDAEGEAQRYFLPLTAAWGGTADGAAPLARLEGDGQTGALLDGAADPALATALLDAMRAGADVAGEGGRLACEGGGLPGSWGAPRPMGAEQSNASIACGEDLVLKLYRRLRPGTQPDIEVGRFLTGREGFDAAPALLGTVAWRDAAGEETVLAAASAWVRNRGDAWSFVTEGLAAALRAPGPAMLDVGGHDLGALLGRRTAQMHAALASGEPGSAFDVAPLDADALAALVAETEAEVAATLDRLAAARLDGAAAATAARVLDRRDAILGRIRAVASRAPSGGAGRVHGDYHLGQVLVTADDLVIIDFEGEPSRSLDERRARSSPLRDVAGMLRSFDYAVRSVAADGAAGDGAATRADAWRAATSAAFLEAWRATMGASPLRPVDPAFEDALLDLFLLRKCAYEVDYERGFRPAWIDVPLRGMLHVLEDSE